MHLTGSTFKYNNISNFHMQIKHNSKNPPLKPFKVPKQTKNSPKCNKNSQQCLTKLKN